MDLLGVTFRTAASVFIALRSRPVRIGAYSFASALVSLTGNLITADGGLLAGTGGQSGAVASPSRERQDVSESWYKAN